VNRTAVLIGVDRSGQLPVLRDAARGARRMEGWARAQGFKDVRVFTDEHGTAVDVGEVKKAIFEIVDAGTTEQLFVYFAGHGVNIGYNERWLLTDAPRDTQAAVNVAGSVLLAPYCGITHVVLMSDACRTAAEGIQAQGVTGSEIFPNEGADGGAKPVDQFYACTLGQPAHEIKDAQTAATAFCALYTDAVLDGLRGVGCAVDWVVEGSEQVGYVRPWPLQDYLEADMERRIRQARLNLSVVQVPDAKISSRQNAWISRVAPADAPPGLAPRPFGPSGPRPAPVAPAKLSAQLLHSALRVGVDFGQTLDAARSAEVISTPAAGHFGARIATATERISEPFGPAHHESECGFKVRGARLVEAWSPRADTQIVSADDVRVEAVEPPGASVVLRFEDGTGISLPAIRGFLAALTVEEGELVDVAYEPSDNSDRWPLFEERALEVRRLRAVASAATRNGVFRLDGEDGLELARQMQYAKGIDPSLAVYAAYAYQDLQQFDLIRQMSWYMRDDIGARLFDIALLAREIDGTTAGTDPEVLSFMPMLSQGWALLSALRVSLPPRLEGLRRALLPSVWTLFAPEGVDLLRAALQAGEVR
jgi:hypothetical protein